VSHLHLRHINPLPPKLGEVFRGFRRVLVPENNMGQLSSVLRSRFSADIIPWPKVEGRPFLIREIRQAIEKNLGK